METLLRIEVTPWAEDGPGRKLMRSETLVFSLSLSLSLSLA